MTRRTGMQPAPVAQTGARYKQTPAPMLQTGAAPNAAANPSGFTPPSLQQVSDYCRQRSSVIDPQRFVDYYEANGWMRGKFPMRDWKEALRSWEMSEDTNPKQPCARPSRRDRRAAQKSRRSAGFSAPSYVAEELDQIGFSIPELPVCSPA